MKFEHHRLHNGLELIAEVDPHALSTAVGFFVRTGSRDETADVSGVSHFLEHMAFKGSERRSADDVNRQFDDIGAKYNAYTSEEHTVYHAAVLPEYLPQTIDLLSDLLRPSLRVDDFEMEKKVILEEIGMYADSPMYNAYERAMRVHFFDHPLGNSVLGTRESVSALTPEAMLAYHVERYSPGNVFIAATGKLDWQALIGLVEERCGSWSPATSSREVRRSHKSGAAEIMHQDSFVQECLFLLTPAPPADSTQRFAADVLSNIIGDETGSRFHWELEEPGKVESCDFSYNEYEGLGLFTANLSCRPEQTAENLDAVRAILDDIRQHGVTAAELTQAKNKLGSRIVLSAERPRNRLSSLAYNWSYRKEYRDVAADLEDLNGVTLDAIRSVLADYPLQQSTIIALGPLKQLPNL